MLFFPFERFETNCDAIHAGLQDKASSERLSLQLEKGAYRKDLKPETLKTS